MVLMEHSAVHEISDVLFVALSKEEHGLGISLGSLPQPLSVGVLSNAFQDGFHGACQLLNAFFLLFRGRLQSRPRAGACSDTTVLDDGTAKAMVWVNPPLLTRPAQSVEINRRKLRVRAVRTAHGCRRGQRGGLVSRVAGRVVQGRSAIAFQSEHAFCPKEIQK